MTKGSHHGRAVQQPLTLIGGAAANLVISVSGIICARAVLLGLALRNNARRQSDQSEWIAAIQWKFVYLSRGDNLPQGGVVRLNHLRSRGDRYLLLSLPYLQREIGSHALGNFD